MTCARCGKPIKNGRAWLTGTDGVKRGPFHMRCAQREKAA